jgi:putative ABC transport system substrate-binding protein
LTRLGHRPALLRGMREVGYVQGRDFTIEWRFAEGRNELLSDLAAELVRLNVDVIVLGTSAAVHPTKRATATIPIVMGVSSDPEPTTMSSVSDDLAAT